MTTPYVFEHYAMRVIIINYLKSHDIVDVRCDRNTKEITVFMKTSGGRWEPRLTLQEISTLTIGQFCEKLCYPTTDWSDLCERADKWYCTRKD